MATMTRRAFLALSAATLATTRAHAQVPERVAVVDWALLETMLAIGVVPAAASELIQYRALVVEPELRGPPRQRRPHAPRQS